MKIEVAADGLQLPLTDTQRDLVRPTSKAVFQSIYALEFLCLIAQERRFYQSQLAKAAGCNANHAGQFMKRLTGGGLIAPAGEPEPGQQRHYFQRAESPLWEVVVDLATKLLAAEPAAGTNVAQLSRRP